MKLSASHKEQSSTWRILVIFDMRRYKNWAHKIGSLKISIWRPVLPVFPQAQNASFLLSTLDSFQGVLKVSSCRSTWFNACSGRWEVSVGSWHCLTAMQETWVWSLDLEDPLEEEIATPSSILAWKIPWIEESGRLQSMGSQNTQTRLNNWACTHAHLRTESLSYSPTTCLCTSPSGLQSQIFWGLIYLVQDFQGWGAQNGSQTPWFFGRSSAIMIVLLSVGQIHVNFLKKLINY